MKEEESDEKTFETMMVRRRPSTAGNSEGRLVKVDMINICKKTIP
jgi:hypothetical protein